MNQSANQPRSTASGRPDRGESETERRVQSQANDITGDDVESSYPLPDYQPLGVNDSENNTAEMRAGPSPASAQLSVDNSAEQGAGPETKPQQDAWDLLDAEATSDASTPNPAYDLGALTGSDSLQPTSPSPPSLVSFAGDEENPLDQSELLDSQDATVDNKNTNASGEEHGPLWSHAAEVAVKTEQERLAEETRRIERARRRMEADRVEREFEERNLRVKRGEIALERKGRGSSDVDSLSQTAPQSSSGTNPRSDRLPPPSPASKRPTSQSLLTRSRVRSHGERLPPSSLLKAAGGTNDSMSSNRDSSASRSTRDQRSRTVTDPSVFTHGHFIDPFTAAPISRSGHRRVRVVQLLVFGMVGIIGGFFGSIFVQSACHFVTGQVEVGEKGQVFDVHFGMWKYTPIDSVFQGYTYCYKYEELDDISGSPPRAPRIFGLVGLLSGSFSLSVLWIYLILGSTGSFFWKWAVRLLLIAALAQGLTFLFFRSALCQQNHCGMGPGAVASLVSTAAWLVLSYEMYHNSPTLALLPMNNQMPKVDEFMDQVGLKEVWMWINPPPDPEDIPSLSYLAQRNQQHRATVSQTSSSIGEFQTQGDAYSSTQGSYMAPTVDSRGRG